MLETKIITPANVGGNPKQFMTIWECPVCHLHNEDTFLIDGCDYQCDGCKSILLYQVPKQRPRKKKKTYYSYIITRNF